MVESKKLGPKDFNFIGILGRGAYGRVAKAQKKDTGEVFAIKIVDKSHLQKVSFIQEGKTSQALIEKNILAKLRNHPGTVRLFFTFQDTEKLYYVLEYCPNGDFLGLINSFKGNMPLQLIKFYAAELIDILQHMFELNVVHRDLKPENLLLTEDYHLKLSDFGTARDLGEAVRDRRNTFVGTAEYVSPEVLADQEAGIEADLWALGCIVYQMLVGRPPFQGTSQYLTFEQIRKISFEFPENIDAEGLDLVRKLLVLEPSLRLGAGGPGSENGILALKNHAFVQDFNIANILSSVVPYSDWDLFLKPKALEDLDDDDEDFEVQLLNKTNEETKASSQPMILVSGIIKKKCGWFYKKRYLIISNEPRIYYSHTNNQKVTDIALSKELKAETKAGNDFVITNPQRSYYFREMISNPQRWVDAINKVIIDHYY